LAGINSPSAKLKFGWYQSNQKPIEYEESALSRANKPQDICIPKV